jgi:hypothetical protein
VELLHIMEFIAASFGSDEFEAQLISDWKSQGGDQAREELQQALEKCKLG